MITVVSGQARSGTSLTMQMLLAAGLPIWWNRHPNCTVINPRGHYELHNDIWLHPEHVRRQAQGKVIKVFPSNWKHLTADCRVIYLDRDPACIAPSQKIMLRAEKRTHERDASVADITQWRKWALEHLTQFAEHIVIQYEDLFTGVGAVQLCSFLKLVPEAADTMLKCVDESLHHFKSEVR